MPTNGINNRHTLGKLLSLYFVVWSCSLISCYCNLSSGRRLSSTSVPVPPTPTSLTSSGASPTEICKRWSHFPYFSILFMSILCFLISHERPVENWKSLVIKTPCKTHRMMISSSPILMISFSSSSVIVSWFVVWTTTSSVVCRRRIRRKCGHDREWICSHSSTYSCNDHWRRSIWSVKG